MPVIFRADGVLYGTKIWDRQGQRLDRDDIVWGQQEDQAGKLQTEEKEKEQELEDLLNANEGELPEEENPIAHVGELQQSPILKLVLPKDAAVSEKQLAEADLLEHREKTPDGEIFRMWQKRAGQ